MKLTISKRIAGKKGETNRLRKQGNIPAILYGMKESGVPVQLKAEELKALMRGIRSGLLSTTLFELAGDGHKHKAIIKEIQYNVASYEIEHIDFAIVHENQPVTVNVPIQMVGIADCVGVKLGGFLRQAIRTLKVSCLPQHIPQEFTVDVRELNIAESKRLSDISLPSQVRPLGKMNEVAVVVAKKAGA